MPYKIKKQKCKQSDGDAGSHVLSYTSKKGKKHRACHTSKKKAQGQIAAIEGGPREADEFFEKELEEANKKKSTYRPGRGRYTITRKGCKQKRTNKSGTHVMSYVDHQGNTRTACHTSSKKAKRQVSKIEKWLKNIGKEESLRRFVRECLNEVEQNMYSIGLEDGH